MILNRTDSAKDVMLKRRESSLQGSANSQRDVDSMSNLPSGMCVPFLDEFDGNKIGARDVGQGGIMIRKQQQQNQNQQNRNSNLKNTNGAHDDFSNSVRKGSSKSHYMIPVDVVQNSSNRKQLLPRPAPPSKCPLLCVFYAEFDIVVGPKVCFSSPSKFMNLDVSVTNNDGGGGFGGEVGANEVNAALEEAFSSVLPKWNATNTVGVKGGVEKGNGPGDSANHPAGKKGQWEEGTQSLTYSMDEEEKQYYWDWSNTNSATTIRNPQQSDSNFMPESRSPSITSSKGHISNQNSNMHEGDHSTIDTDMAFQNSVFSATSEYIITGNELANQTITVSTHGMHILSRPTIICNERRYERNSLLFALGFVLRRNIDPRPYWPLLSNLSSTFRHMEVESEFLTNPTSRPRIQIVLEDILISLNSKQKDCHLLLDDANLLNLQLFKPPPPPTPPVPDYSVPLLLRPEWQLQMYDWDLTINWIVPHVDGVKNVEQIAHSSEVDMEMVRACLRVLRHHGVLAHVDVFRYSNVYECTPRAMDLLSAATMDGTDTQPAKNGGRAEEKLLDSAFLYAAKAKYLQRMQITRGRFYSSTSESSLNYHHLSSTPLNNHHKYNNLSSIHGLDLSLHSANPLTSLVNETIRVRSLDHEMYSQPRSFPSRTNNHGVSEMSPRNRRDGVELNLSVHKELASMKLALARIFSSCTRKQTFGEVLVTKISESETNASVDDSPDSNDESSSDGHEKNMLSPLREGTESSVGSPSASPTFEHPKHPKPSGTHHHIDWKKAFHCFDHRRLVTFGVLHGLIKRVHRFPLAYEVRQGSENSDEELSPDGGIDHTTSYGDDDILDDMSADFLNGMLDMVESPILSSNHHVLGTQSLQEPETTSLPTVMDGNASVVLSPSLSLSPSIWARGGGGNIPPPPLVDTEHITSRLSQHKQQLHARKLLLEKIACSMDGTRCDDELSCMFQMPIEDLVEKVKGTGRWDVISVFSSMESGHENI